MAGDSDNIRSLTPLRPAGRALEHGLVDNSRIGALIADQGHGEGLLCEELHTSKHEPWSPFPQTCCMAGSIDSALHLSHSWEEAV